MGSGSDSPSVTRAPTSSFFTGIGGECEGISCREEVTALAGVLPLHPPIHPGTHFVEAMAINEAAGIQVESGIGIIGPGEGREAEGEGG